MKNNLQYGVAQLISAQFDPVQQFIGKCDSYLPKLHLKLSIAVKQHRLLLPVGDPGYFANIFANILLGIQRYWVALPRTKYGLTLDQTRCYPI